MGRWLAILVAGVLATACTQVSRPIEPISPQPPDALSRAASLTATCSGCHGPRGDAISDLSGRSALALQQALEAYARNDGNTVMHRLARGYSDAEIQIISEMLAAGDNAP